MNTFFNKKARWVPVIAAALLIFTACRSATPPPPPETSGARAFQEGVPGEVVINTTKVSARVTAIDYDQRKVTLLGADGEPFTVKVGPAAVNFDQVKKGDLVNLTLTEELVIFLDDERAPQGDGSAAMVSRAPKGSQPGGLMAETTQITGTVTSIDLMNHTATLRFEDGTTKTFKVRDDVDLGKHKAGERVVFRFTEMVAIRVDKP